MIIVWHDLSLDAYLKLAESIGDKKAHDCAGENFRPGMAMNFLDGVIIDVESQGKVVSKTVEGCSLQAGRAPYAERIADNDEGKEERDDEEIGKTLGEGDGGAYRYGDGRMAGRHTARAPEEDEHGFPEIFAASCLYQGDDSLDELRYEEAEKCRKEYRVFKEGSEFCGIGFHRSRIFTFRPSPVKSSASLYPGTSLTAPGQPRYHCLMKAAISQVVSTDDEGRRLDRLLRIILKDIPLSALHKALRKGDIRVDGIRRKPDYRCHAGDTIEYSRFFLPAAVPETGSGSKPELSGLSVVLETPDLLFVDKPAGILVHDGSGSLEALARAYLADKLEPSLAFRPGPLHRLDRNTSGLIAFSKSLAGATVFSKALRQGRVCKTYLALLEGFLEKDERWEDTLSRDTYLRRSFVDSAGSSPEEPSPGGSGRQAVTEVFPIASDGTITLAAMRLLTGRTHQIRAQGAHHGLPLLGDTKYGGSRASLPYYLHAWRISFGERLFIDLPQEISTPLPLQFDKKILSSFSNPEKEVYSVLRKFRFQEGT